MLDCVTLFRGSCDNVYRNYLLDVVDTLTELLLTLKTIGETVQEMDQFEETMN